jgi:hypothetical protein
VNIVKYHINKVRRLARGYGTRYRRTKESLYLGYFETLSEQSHWVVPFEREKDVRADKYYDS